MPPSAATAARLPRLTVFLQNSRVAICDPRCFRGMLLRWQSMPKTEWFKVQALECIALALRANDPRIKRLYALEAERWLRLTELQVDSPLRDGSTVEVPSN